MCINLESYKLCPEISQPKKQPKNQQKRKVEKKKRKREQTKKTKLKPLQSSTQINTPTSKINTKRHKCSTNTIRNKIKKQEHKTPKKPLFQCRTDTAREKKISNEYASINIDKLRKRIANALYYPRKARRRHIEGIVKVQFTLTTKGNITNIHIVDTPNNTLSKAALKTLQNIKNFSPKPSKNIIINLPISYKLDMY